MLIHESTDPRLPNLAITIDYHTNNADGSYNVVYSFGSETPGVTAGQMKWRRVFEQCYLPYIGESFQREFYDEFTHPAWENTPFPIRRLGFAFTGNATHGACSAVGDFEQRPYDPTDYQLYGNVFSCARDVNTGEARVNLRGRGHNDLSIAVSDNKVRFLTQTEYVELFSNAKSVGIGECIQTYGKAPEGNNPDERRTRVYNPITFDQPTTLIGLGTPSNSIGLISAESDGHELGVVDRKRQIRFLPKVARYNFGNDVDLVYQLNHAAYHDGATLGSVIRSGTRKILVMGEELGPGVSYTAEMHRSFALLKFSTPPGNLVTTITY